MKINLENILNEFISFTRSLRNINEPQLISFAFQFEQFDPLAITDILDESFKDIYFDLQIKSLQLLV